MQRMLTALVFALVMAGYLMGQPGVPGDTRITLERGYCLGDCLPYKVTIFSDGTVDFEAIIFDAEGNSITASAFAENITLDKLKVLVSEFEKIDFFSLGDYYPENCPTSMKNNPLVTTSITIMGKSKRVRRQFGCKVTAMMERLTALEKRIDEVVDTEKLLKLLPNLNP